MFAVDGNIFGDVRGVSVLVVDDEEGVRNALKNTLLREGYVVETAESGEEALELLSDKRFNLIICDYKLPGINGVETIAQAKKSHPDFASILITGYGSDETIIDAFTRGKVDFYLSKPFELRELRKVAPIALKDLWMREKERAFKEELRCKVEEATSELKEKNRLLATKESETARLNERLREEQERLKKVNERLEELSITDELTGLFNYRYFTERLDEEFNRVTRYSGKLSLIMLDIDDFKKVNDQYGHLAGDEVLRRVGNALVTSSRQIDLAARYGGEEFAILLPEVGLSGASLRAERLREAVSSLVINYGEESVSVTVSVGVSSYILNGMEEPNDLIREADGALYHAKTIGKNCVVISKSGKFDTMGKQYSLTEKQGKDIFEEISIFAGANRSLSDILNFLVQKLEEALAPDSKGFYISIMMENGLGTVEELVSLGEYHGGHALKKIVARVMRTGTLETITNNLSDPLSCFPIKISPEGGADSAIGALVFNRVPSYTDFIENLLAEVSLIIKNAAALEKVEDQRGRLERQWIVASIVNSVISDIHRGSGESAVALRGYMSLAARRLSHLANITKVLGCEILPDGEGLITCMSVSDGNTKTSKYGKQFFPKGDKSLIHRLISIGGAEARPETHLIEGESDIQHDDVELFQTIDVKAPALVTTIVSRGRVVGVFIIEVEKWNAEDMELVGGFMKSFSFALENMETVKRLEANSSRHNLLARFTRSIVRENFEGGFKETLARHGASINELLNASTVSVRIYNSINDRFDIHFSSGKDSAGVEKDSILKLESTMLDLAVKRFSEKGDGGAFLGSDSLLPCLCAPMTSGAKLLGVVIATRRKGASLFDDDDMEIAEALSDIISVSMLHLSDNSPDGISGTRKEALS